jgi:hypothetical protein
MYRSQIKIVVILVFLASLAITDAARATLISEYRFDNVGTTVVDSAPATPNLNMLVRPNGTSFAPASTNGTSVISDQLGLSGQMSEPVEPTTEDNEYGFWVSKTLLSSRTEWTVILWFNRNDLDNNDFLFYVGTGDGFGGTGAETYLYAPASGGLAVGNYASNSTKDMDIRGGSTAADTWYQAALTRDGSTFSLFLDGQHLGTDTSVSLNSFNSSSNSVIVFGAAKWMRLAYMRARVLDGLIDQIEVYDVALSEDAILDRYDAFAVPEPSSLVLLSTSLMVLLKRRRSSAV